MTDAEYEFWVSLCLFAAAALLLIVKFLSPVRGANGS